MNSPTKSLFIVFALFAAAALTACNKGSVVSDAPGQSVATTASPATASTTASPQATSSPAATPSLTPTPPAGPNGQATPASPFDLQPGEKKQMMGNLPVVVGPAKPAMTPAPDPFPARPAPTVVTQNGKIVQQWQAPADVAGVTNPVKDRPNAANIGREFYMQKCVDCHGKEGKGNGYMSAHTKRDGKPLPPTNLASQMVQANTDGELFWKITNGKSPMPAHRVRFEDEQRWYIVAYLRTLKP